MLCAHGRLAGLCISLAWSAEADAVMLLCCAVLLQCCCVQRYAAAVCYVILSCASLCCMPTCYCTSMCDMLKGACLQGHCIQLVSGRLFTSCNLCCVIPGLAVNYSETVLLLRWPTTFLCSDIEMTGCSHHPIWFTGAVRVGQCDNSDCWADQHLLQLRDNL